MEAEEPNEAPPLRKGGATFEKRRARVGERPGDATSDGWCDDDDACPLA